MHKIQLFLTGKFVQFALLTNPIIHVIIITEKRKGGNHYDDQKRNH